MIDAIIRWSLTNRSVVLALAVALTVWGALTAQRMAVDVFPDLTAPTVTVIADAHGMAPVEMETLVTRPIEAALNGAAGVRRVRSSTAVGIAVIWVEFDWGQDIFRARQLVTEKLQLVRDRLPPDMEPPILAPISSVMGEILFIALTGDGVDPMAVRTLADWEVRRRLLAEPGVSQVVPIGGDVKQYQVHLEPEKMAALGVSAEEVLAALAASSENATAGLMTEGGEERLIYGIGRAKTTDDIGAALIKRVGGRPVQVRDVAEVHIGPALKRGEGSFNGQPAVILGIQKQPDVNTLELTERLDGVLDGLEKTLPEGVHLHRDIFRQADFIEVSVDNVSEALRDGAVLVVLIVLLFLTSMQATVITAVAIPLSLLGAVLALAAMGASLNTMTLGGMAIAVGALVDDAIIDVENVVRRLREWAARQGEDPRSALEVVFEASKEIRGSIVFATLIILLVFLPIFFLHGVEGRLLQPLGVAYVLSLAVSLVVALTVTPVLCLWLLPRSRAIEGAEEGRLSRWLKGGYEPPLRWLLPRWGLLSVGSVALLVVAVGALASAGRAFLPDFNEGTLTISAVTVPGIALASSDQLGRMVEGILLDQPEVVATARRTGRAELDEHAQGVNAAEIDVSLKMGERSKAEFLADLRGALTAVPGTNIVLGQPISHRIDHMLSGTRANIAVKVFGPDLATLRRLAQEVKGAMEGVPGVVDLSEEQQIDVPLVTFRLDREAIALHGLTVRDVVEAAEVAFGGHVAGQILEGEASFDLLVRYDRRGGDDLDAIRRAPIPTPDGAWIPLGALADVQRDLGPNTVSREDVQRVIVVMCNVSGRALTEVVEDIRAQIEGDVALPTGYRVEYGGQFEAAESASKTLLWLGLAVIAGIFFLLLTAFGSGRDALVVMANLPLALIGGVAGVYLTGGTVTLAAIIGFITLFGIATRNGIMMVSHIRHLVQEEGVTDRVEAVVQGASERLVPILMTALASGLGLLPLALAMGEPGSEIQAPMAVVILCGLVTSTLLNMVVVPAAYLRFGDAWAREES